MSRADQAERAEAFAREAHRGQTDKAGEDYSGHLGRVAARVEGDGVRAVACLSSLGGEALSREAPLRDPVEAWRKAACAGQVRFESEAIRHLIARTRARAAWRT